MLRLAIFSAVMLMTLPSAAAERQRVAATDLVAAAQAMLVTKASAEHIDAQFALVGHVDDLQLAAIGAVSVRAGDLKGPWLRPRIGVPVQVIVDDRPVSSATIWFSVTAPAQALVYTTNDVQGSADAQLQTGIGTIDLARTHGESMTSLDAVAGQRLRHAVSVGQAVLSTDFEPVPTVTAQQQVRIETTSGVVHLSIAGRALSDGQIGQTIAVLPANASQPVRARVMSNQVVIIEN
jgi:flagella basal body P-ring formation protein FlgA